ncbi:DNA-directed RNA polymerase subunit beta' [compost metagenome]|jgi:hypothetical protein
MNRYPARDIYQQSEADVWTFPDDKFIIVFDDGDLEVEREATIYSWYCAIFNRMYPALPHLKKSHMGSERLTKDTFNSLMAFGRSLALDYCNANHIAFDNAEWSGMIYDVEQAIYNGTVTTLEEHAASICITDFTDVIRHPKIAKANADAKPTQNSIDDTYRAVKSVLMDENELIGNPIGKAVKSKLVSMGQVLQVVSLRGFLTDIDSRIFHEPVMRNYTQGLVNLYDALIESRSASKALWAAKDPVADSEYFNRKMQLGCATLQHIHYGDCGSTGTMMWRVTAGNFAALEGKYRVTDQGLKPILKSERFLIGTEVHVRTVLKCRHPDRYGVCSTCMGELAFSIPPHTVLGHVSATTLCELVSQNVLSTKHLDGSSVVDDFEINEHDAAFLRLGTSGNEIKLNADLAGQPVKMIIPADYAPRLPDLNRVRTVRALPLEKLSEIIDITLEIPGPEDTADKVNLSVSMGSRLSYLTEEALIYIKRTGWDLTARGDYVIDLSGWDYTDVLFKLPMKHTNMVEYMGEIERFIKAAPTRKGKQRGKRSRVQSSNAYSNTEEALFAFYGLISSKLSVNIQHLEVIILSTMVESIEGRDHRLPLDRENGEVGYYEDNMDYRSLAASMAYERQGATLQDIRTFTLKNRPDHPLDALMMGDLTRKK